jgi:signal transduction histidine kinase
MSKEEKSRKEAESYKQQLEDARKEIAELKMLLSAEKAKRAKEHFTSKQMSALIANLQMGVLVESADRYIIKTNKHFCSLFGIPSPDVMAGMNCDKAAEAAAPLFDRPREFLETIQKRLREGRIVTNEELKLKDGRTFKRDYVPVFNEGVFIGNMWLYRDITERKNNELKLKENAEELRELNATKDKFFTIIAHDLRNPFTNILGFSELIQELVQEEDYESLVEFSQMIYDSAYRGMNLLQNLLTWARSQTGKIQFNPQSVDLLKLIQQNVDLKQESLESKEISMQVQVPEDLTLIADEDMLNTIFRNLISNAIKFSYEGGIITINATSHSQMIYIEVKDNGTGMSEQHRNKLFKLEENVTTEGTQKERGTGLGLLLCKEFIDYHQGTITVTSQRGQGTTFRISLPVSGR